MEKMADFAGILLKNLGPISLEYEKKSPFCGNFLGKGKKKWFCIVLRTFLTKQNGNFANLFLGGGDDKR